MLRIVGKTIILGGIAGLLLAGCLNQVGPRKTNSKFPIISDPGSDDEIPPTVLVEKLVRTQVDPRGAIDLIGEAAFTEDAASSDATPRPHGELGSFCSGPNNSSSCSCVVRATVIKPCPTNADPETCTPQQKTIEESFNPLYYEDDLVRCPLPEDWNTNVLEVALIKNDGSSGVSNRLSLTITPPMSFEDPLFYAEVQRYACRWSPFIPHMMDGTVLDTIQSVSPEATLGLIYYSTNMGRAMAQFSDSKNQEYFECPPHVNPGNVSMAMRLATANQFIPLADNAGNPLGDDQVNFLLAKSQVGPFQVGLQVSQAPNTASEVLGYAARSVSGGCPRPDEVVIPNNMEWRKLWMYHGAQKRRGRYTVTKFQQFHMACNPGAFKGSDVVVQNTSPVASIRANQYSVFSDCGNRGTQPFNFLDVGTACLGPTGGGHSRILRPIVRESESSGSRSTVPERCVSIDDFGSFWRDECSTSQYSCAQNGSNPLTDILGLCQAPAGTLKTQFSETSGDAIWSEFTNAPVEYLFVTTKTDEAAPETLQRPRYNDPAFTDAPASGQASETYQRLGQINGADFPLCVLRKAGAP